MTDYGDETYNILDEWKYRAITAEKRVRELTVELAEAQRLTDHFQLTAEEAVDTLMRHEALSGEALDQLDAVVNRLTAEEHGPPPHRVDHPSNVRLHDDD